MGRNGLISRITEAVKKIHDEGSEEVIEVRGGCIVEKAVVYQRADKTLIHVLLTMKSKEEARHG
jgi:hypothetical protein